MNVKYFRSVSVLLSNPHTSVYITGNIGRNALHIAAEKGFCEIIRIIQRKRPAIDMNIPETSSAGWSAMHLAAHYKNAEVVDTLLRLGADLEVLDKQFSYTPLIFAVLSKCTQSTLLLIESHANCLVKDNEDKNLLHISSHNGDDSVVRVLIQSGLSVNDSYSPSCSTPLHYAVTGGHLETSRILIEAGADVNAVNDQNVTPLLMSVVNGDSRMFR